MRVGRAARGVKGKSVSGVAVETGDEDGWEAGVKDTTAGLKVLVYAAFCS